MLLAQTTTTVVNAVSLSLGAGSLMRDLAMPMIVALVPLAVAVLLAKLAMGYAAKMMGFSDSTSHRYRDSYFEDGEAYDIDEGRFYGSKDGSVYSRRAGVKRRRYERD